MPGNVGDQNASPFVVGEQKIIEVASNECHWKVASSNAKAGRSWKSRRENRDLNATGDLKFLLNIAEFLLLSQSPTPCDYAQTSKQHHKTERLDVVVMREDTNDVVVKSAGTKEEHAPSDY